MHPLLFRILKNVFSYPNTRCTCYVFRIFEKFFSYPFTTVFFVKMFFLSPFVWSI
eukprot:UN27189